MSSTRPTRRNITAAEQRRLEEMERNRRINLDGSTGGRVMHERQEERGQLGQEGGDNGHAAMRDEMERLRAENRRLRDLTGELQETREGPAGSTDDSDLVEAFLDFEKHAKVSSASKAINEQGFKKLGGVTNYEGWKKSFQTVAEIHNLWEMYEGRFDALSTTTIQTVLTKFKRLCRNAMDILHTACDGTIRSSLQSESIELPSQAMSLLGERNRQRGSAIVWSLFKEFLGTTLANTGSVSEFRNKLIEIQEKLVAVDTGYRLPSWLVNSHFLTALTSAFDNKVAVLSSDESIVGWQMGRVGLWLGSDIIQPNPTQHNPLLACLAWVGLGY